jgi:hypothetical protein
MQRRFRGTFLTAVVLIWLAAAVNRRLTVESVVVSLLFASIVLAIEVTLNRKGVSRRIVYWFTHQVPSMAVWPLNRLALLLFTRWVASSYHSVSMIDFDERAGLTASFVESATLALKLLGEHAPVRFRRILREIRVIMNHPLKRAAAVHIRALRACQIDYRKVLNDYPGEDRKKELGCWIAALLVHEATHARLHSLRIPYTRQTRNRVEQICILEAWRFLNRLPEAQFPFKEAQAARMASLYHPQLR